jgi:hypothetical protein
MSRPLKIDDVLLDRMVDGELSLDEQQALLSRADRQPELWRPLALAYVQSQLWKQELTVCAGAGRMNRCETDAGRTIGDVTDAARSRGVQNDEAGDVERSATHCGTLPRPDAQRFRSAGAATSAAAVFLVAVALGYGIGVVHERQTPGGDAARVVDAPSSLDPVRRGPDAGLRQPGDVPKPRLVDGAAAQRHGGEPARPTRPVAHSVLRLAVDSPDGDAIEVPLYEPSQIDDLMVQQGAQPIVTPEMTAQLQAMGYRLHQHRNLVPIAVDDGSHVLLPVDRIRIEPVGQTSYQ